MIKRLIFQENIIILNIYVANNRSSKYVRQKLKKLQEEIDKYTTGHFNASLSVLIDQVSRKSVRI